MEKEIQRIVDLRQSGLTWWQVEEIMFPENLEKKIAEDKSEVWKIACKHKKGLAAGAFMKRVEGAFTPTQVVAKLRERVVPMQGQVRNEDFIFSM